MTNSTSILRLPRSLANRIRAEAEKRGLSIDEYLLELVISGLDPPERAREYSKASRDLLKQAKEELRRQNARQAAEKAWSADVLAVKAYASWREGRRLTSHGELWSYIHRLVSDIGEWVLDAWNAGQSMHVCFYEGWCDGRHVELALKRIEKLVKTVEESIKE